MNGWQSEAVGIPILRVVVDDLAVTIEGSMDYLVGIDFAQPHVVALIEGVEDVHRDVRSAHLSNNGSIGAVSHVNSAVLLGSIAN